MHLDRTIVNLTILIVVSQFLVCAFSYGNENAKLRHEKQLFLQKQIVVGKVLLKEDKKIWDISLELPRSLPVYLREGCGQNIIHKETYIQNSLFFHETEINDKDVWVVCFTIDHVSLKNCELLFTVVEQKLLYTVRVEFEIDYGKSGTPKVSHKITVPSLEWKHDHDTRKKKMNPPANQTRTQSTKALRKPHAN